MCCYYSDTAASLVVAGMRMLARSQNEAPFACLSRALLQQDIEVKAAVMQVHRNHFCICFFAFQ